MASRVIIAFVALVALLALSYGLEAPEDGIHFHHMQEEEHGAPPGWVPCQVGVDPKFSCHDCYTRVICTPVGGRLVKCHNPFRPYCNADTGFCSHAGGEECDSIPK